MPCPAEANPSRAKGSAEGLIQVDSEEDGVTGIPATKWILEGLISPLEARENAG